MAVPSFLFGGDTKETPASIKQKRDLVRALMGASNAPKNIGEGLNALGDGIVANVLDRRATAAETEGTSAANSLFNSILGIPASTPGAISGATTSSPASVNAAAPTDMSGNDVYNGFIDTVKTGVTNPFGLAAVAATGKAESSFDPKKAVATWSDPSESGKPGTAGGIMSWRGPRYQALAATGDLSPAGQGKFFLNENPGLIKALNNAKSVGEAQQLMNNAWAFAGYNRPGGEAARRLSSANAFLPKFQGQGNAQEVASLDHSAGMPAAQAAAPGYVDPVVRSANPITLPSSGPIPTPRPEVAMNGNAGTPQPLSDTEFNSRFGAAPAAGTAPDIYTQGVPDLPPPRTVGAAPNVAAVPEQPVRPQPAAPNSQVAQNDRFGGVDPRLLQALQNPFLNEGQKSTIQLLVQQQQQAAQQQREQQTWQAREEYKRTAERADPGYQLEQDYKKAQLEALRNKTGKTNLINAGEGNIYDPDSKTWIKAPSAQGQTGDAFRFGGNSVEAQALNGLIESQQLTPGQAQQLAAGKTITGPNGEILFLTPQGVFRQQGQAQQSQAASPEVDIFAGTPMGAASQATAVAQPSQANDAIQITSPKAPSNEQLNAAGFADRMNSAGQKLDQYEQQGLNATSQFLTRSPFVPSIIGNTIVGKTNPDYQVFDQAKRDFINAQLRRESGAVIGQDEFDNADKQYFPQPGDSPQVIKQKSQARQLAVESMGRSAGPTYKRPASESDDISLAREAIAKGAPRDKVIQRLKDANIDTTGL